MSTEPCGSLPVTTWSVMVSFCHHHLAWHGTVSTAHQTSESDIRLVHSGQITFGPFDSWEDVAGWVQTQVLDPSIVPPA